MASSTRINHELAGAEAGAHVRSLNPLYRAFGVGRVLKVKDRLCKVEFNPSVFSRPPFRSQNYILGMDEIEICPAPSELAKSGNWDEAWKFDMRQIIERKRILAAFPGTFHLRFFGFVLFNGYCVSWILSQA